MVRKANKSLKDWVTFVKKVQKEENLTYRDAMMRAKTRKNSGEKWQSGGNLFSKLGGEQQQQQQQQQQAPSALPAKMAGGRRKKTAKKQKNGRRNTASKK